jgi:hypothetical protein
MSDTEEDDSSTKSWWITVHKNRRGPYPDRNSAFAAARVAKQAEPNKHVAVVNPKGTSERV